MLRWPNLIVIFLLSKKFHVQGVDPTKSVACSIDSNLDESEYNRRGYRLAMENKYEEALECYSNAINKNSTVAKYLANRAFCSFRLERYDAAVEDCLRALQIDPYDVKSNFFLGSAYIELEKFHEAVEYLHTAYDSAKEQRLSYGDDIASQLRLARRKKWRLREEERLAAENKLGLFPYLKQLIQEDKQREIDKLKEASGSRGVDEVAQNKKIAEIEQKYRDYVKDLTAILSRADEKTKRRELPDYLCGRMNYKLLVEPVITPKGDTYEKEDLSDHFRRYGYFDPLNPDVMLRNDELVPNLAIKEAAEAFSRDNSDWLPEFEEYVKVITYEMEE